MRIKCRDCNNELNGKCKITKMTVKLTKSRKCNEYSFDQARELVRLERKARVLDQQDRAYKSKVAAINKVMAEQEAHPSTGDLSRFKTTAT